MKNDPLYNHVVFGPEKGRGGVIGKTDEQLIHDLINIHNAENWLGMDGDSELMPVLKDADVAEDGKKTSSKSKTKIHVTISLRRVITVLIRDKNRIAITVVSKKVHDIIVTSGGTRYTSSR